MKALRSLTISRPSFRIARFISTLKRLGNIEHDSFQHATTAQTSDTDFVLSSLQGLQVRKLSIPSYSKDMRESNQIRVALRREIFHEAVQKGLATEEAKQLAEKILQVVEKVIAERCCCQYDSSKAKFVSNFTFN
uniref:Uncharacterized protein n=1 Tax=Panagrolaimus davidi TaxID=227884 RepID=A0A914PSP1_9BILA